jgi:hypothetical protein
MLDWILDRLMAVLTYVPALIVAPGSPNFYLVRAMFGLILISFVIYLIAVRSEIISFARGLIESCMQKFEKQRKRPDGVNSIGDPE